MKLRVKNWSQFQHYKDRNPSWIKLHKSLLDNFEFHRLPVASRALAPMIWLLASEEQTGEIDFDLEKIAFRLRMTDKEVEDALAPLVSGGFLECSDPASSLLATPERDASPEKERELETEIETEKNYAFLGSVVRLTEKDFDRWRKAYPNLNLTAELQALDDYYSTNGVTDWFSRASAALAKRNRTAKRPQDDSEIYKAVM